MGGTIGITVRTPDGKERRMGRWTNPIPYFVNSLKLINDNMEHVNDYFKHDEEMVEDWEENKNTKNFKFPMTPCYGPHNGQLAPVEYGMVVVDMVNKKILSMQGYSALGEFFTCGGKLPDDEFGRGSMPERADQFVEWLEAGRISQAFVPGRPDKINNPTRKQLEAFAVKHHSFSMKLDMSPYEVVEFKEHTGGMEMLQAIKDLGFSISKEEQKLWERFHKRHTEED